MRKLLLISSLTLFAGGTLAEEIKPLEIVITGGLVPVSRDNVGSSVTVIDAEQIARQNYQFVADILQDVPGLNLSRNGGPGTLGEIRLRGAEADQTLVLIDGIEANDPSQSARFDFAHLLAENVERIEVLRGAQSALWGSDAIGGVINIITKSGAGLAHPQYTVNAEYGSHSSQNVAVGTRGDTGLFDYALSVQHYDTDGFSSADDTVFNYTLADGSILATGGNSEDDAYDNTTAHLKVGFDPQENLHVDAVIRYTEFDSEFDNFTTIPIDGLADRSDGDQQYYLLRGQLTNLGGALMHTLKYFRNESDTDFFSDFGITVAQGTRENYGYQLDYGWRNGASEQGISVAVETEEDSLNSTFSGNRNIDNDSVVGEYRFNNSLFAAAANIRYDNNDLFDDETTWRLAGSWKFLPGLRLHTSYGTGIKNPTLAELFGFTPAFTGNENLIAEQSEGGDIGVEYTSDDGRQFFDITYFHRDIDDLITGSGNTAVNTDGTSTSQGVEVSYQYQLTDFLGIQASYTYNDTEDEQGNPLVRRPEHQFAASLDYLLLQDALKIGVNLRHVKDRVDTAFNDDFTTSLVELDDYTVVDLAARFKLNDFLSIKTRIDNVFDEAYQEVLGYNTPERAYFIGLSGTF